MAIKLEELYSEINIKVDKLNKGLAHATKETRKTTDNISKSLKVLNNPIGLVTSNLVKMMGPLLAVGGAAGVVAFGKNAIQSADHLAKLADNIGISTKFLQEMQHAADLTGVSQLDLNSSLMRFNRRLAEAAMGQAEYAKAYKHMGVAVKDSNGSIRKAEDVIMDVADAIKGMGSESEQASILFKIFGDSGFRLVNLFKNGSAELKRFQAQANSMGLVIEESLLRQAEKTNDQMTILSKVIGTNLKRAILEIAPQIQSMAEGLTNAAVGVVKLISSFSGGGGSKIDDLKERLQNLRSELTEQEKAAKKSALWTGLLPPEGSADKISMIKEQIASTQSEIQKIQEEQEARNAANAELATARTDGAIEDLDREKQAFIQKISEQIQWIQLLETEDMIANEAKIKRHEAMLTKMLKDEKRFNLEVAKGKNFLLTRERNYDKMRIDAASQTFGNLSALQRIKSKEAFEIGKRAAQIQAIIDGIAATQAALRGPPGPPWSIPLAISIGVKTAANVAAIEAQKFARGGEVPGHGTQDNTLIRATPGENVIDRTLSQHLKQYFAGGDNNPMVGWLQRIYGVLALASQNPGQTVVVRIGDNEVFDAVKREIETGRILVPV